MLGILDVSGNKQVLVVDRRCRRLFKSVDDVFLTNVVGGNRDTVYGQRPCYPKKVKIAPYTEVYSIKDSSPLYVSMLPEGL
jgi:hypothetical protein